jgi:hypothetical protein
MPQDFYHPEGTHYPSILKRIKAIAALKSGPDADKRVKDLVDSFGGGWVKKQEKDDK